MINLLSTISPLMQFAEEAEAINWAGDLFIPLIVVLALVLVNGFFVAAEFALLGSRASRMEELSDEGNTKAGSILTILESNPKKNAYLATAQLGITVVTLVLAMYGEVKLAHFFEVNVLEARLGWEHGSPRVFWTGYLVTIFALTYLHVVIGEMIPKSMALGNPNDTIMSLHGLMTVFQRLLYPFVTVLNWIGDLLLKVLRIEPEHGASRLFSSAEIEQIVSESSEGGLIASDAEEMISNIFDFHDREVGQVMTPRTKIQAVPHDIAYADLLKLVTESRHSRFPVYKGDLDHVVGILHLKDLVQHYRASNEPIEIEEILRPTPIVPSTHDVTELLRAFKLQRIHMAVVLDEYGGVAGIVTLEDLVEEIVGEVFDEFDIGKEPFIEIAPGILETSGDYLIDMLREVVFLGEDETIPDVDTVGGLIVTHLGGPPELNDEVVLDNGVKFRVVGAENRAVTRVRIEFPSPDKNDSAETEPEKH